MLLHENQYSGVIKVQNTKASWQVSVRISDGGHTYGSIELERLCAPVQVVLREAVNTCVL